MRQLRLVRSLGGSRWFSSAIPRLFPALPIQVNEEIQQALSEKRPVVALESTIITHGLPYPENLKMAQDVEALVRDQGAIPATMGFIDGIPTVGISESSLNRLASDTSKMVKISRRDIGHVMSHKLSGGTTISSTMILAHMSGIKVFATGGLGGVHRGSETTMDISADLDELGRTPVGVICSGPKSILDIPKTIEYLETKGVYVSTMGPPGTNIPGFYTADSGVPVCEGNLPSVSNV
jgi:pseudouridine-5'-phosphate glycosidase